MKFTINNMRMDFRRIARVVDRENQKHAE